MGTYFYFCIRFLLPIILINVFLWKKCLNSANIKRNINFKLSLTCIMSDVIWQIFTKCRGCVSQYINNDFNKFNFTDVWRQSTCRIIHLTGMWRHTPFSKQIHIKQDKCKEVFDFQTTIIEIKWQSCFYDSIWPLLWQIFDYFPSWIVLCCVPDR